MINLMNLSDALLYLVNNEDSFEKIKKDFPEILADWISMKNNPNCTCKNRVHKFFHEKLLEKPEILNKYINNESEFARTLNEAQDQRSQTNYSGRIFVIPKGEDSWRNFASQASTKGFRSFTVVEKESELVVYFL